jgi:hypothetical protein
MTYGQLKAHIEVMDAAQLKQNVTLYDKDVDEFYPINDIGFSDCIAVLDINHPFLVLKRD